MKKSLRTVHVLLIRGADFPNISFTLKLSMLRIIGVLLVVFVVALGFFAFHYGKIALRFSEMSLLTRENEDLRRKVDKIHELSGEIDRIRDYEKKIRVIARNFSIPEIDTAPVFTATNLFSRVSETYDRDIDGFVQKIRSQREQEFFNTKDPALRRRIVLEAAPNLFPVDGWVSRGYRPEKDPEGEEHPGLDIAGAYDSPIKAAGPGIVSFSGWKKDLGNLVEIDHGFGFVSRYGHCSRLIVKRGDLVERSQTIALLGNSGRSSAPHLHFEILKDGQRSDPLAYIVK